MEEVAEEAAPAITDEQVAAYLAEKGIDYKKAQNLSEFEKDVNKRSSDLGRIAKELEAAATAKDAEMAALKESTEQTIRAEIIARSASAGIDPITRDPEAGTIELESESPKLTGLAKTRAALAAKHKAGYARLN